MRVQTARGLARRKAGVSISSSLSLSELESDLPSEKQKMRGICGMNRLDRECRDFNHIMDVATDTCSKTFQIGNIMQISYISACAENQRVVKLLGHDKENLSHKLYGA